MTKRNKSNANSTERERFFIIMCRSGKQLTFFSVDACSATLYRFDSSAEREAALAQMQSEVVASGGVLNDPITHEVH